jgi:hypothetical protein
MNNIRTIETVVLIELIVSYSSLCVLNCFVNGGKQPWQPLLFSTD